MRQQTRPSHQSFHNARAPSWQENEGQNNTWYNELVIMSKLCMLRKHTGTIYIIYIINLVHESNYAIHTEQFGHVCGCWSAYTVDDVVNYPPNYHNTTVHFIYEWTSVSRTQSSRHTCAVHTFLHHVVRASVHDARCRQLACASRSFKSAELCQNHPEQSNIPPQIND